MVTLERVDRAEHHRRLALAGILIIAVLILVSIPFLSGEQEGQTEALPQVLGSAKYREGVPVPVLVTDIRVIFGKGGTQLTYSGGERGDWPNQSEAVSWNHGRDWYFYCPSCDDRRVLWHPENASFNVAIWDSEVADGARRIYVEAVEAIEMAGYQPPPPLPIP